MKIGEKSSQKNRVTFNEDENIITPFRKTDKIEARKRKTLSVSLPRDKKVVDKDDDTQEWNHSKKKRKVMESDSEESEDLDNSPAVSESK